MRSAWRDTLSEVRFSLVLCSMTLLGCALGGGPPPARDAGPPTDPMDGGCAPGSCVGPPDGDDDGIPTTDDCDDDDPAIGRTAARACTTMCGTGTESCTDGQWSACDAPTTCNCSMPACEPGQVEMGGLCGMCGREERRCRTDCTWGPMECVDEGVCEPGTMDTPQTQSCPGTCGGTQMRTRTCTSSCTWGPYTDWAPSCPSCGPVCGDGTCDSGETCSSCADCRAGHLGTGSGGDSCAGVPEGQWRCVTQASLGQVSQVCRSGSWVNFNTSPMDCSSCVCSFSTACCQPGSPSTGC